MGIVRPAGPVPVAGRPAVWSGRHSWYARGIAPHDDLRQYERELIPLRDAAAEREDVPRFDELAQQLSQTRKDAWQLIRRGSAGLYGEPEEAGYALHAAV